MNKILFISNTANFSKFNRPFMRWFKEQGWQVDYCSAGEENVLDCDNQFSINIARSPFSLKNLQGLKQLKAILVDGNYQILHCHTPMGGVLGRLVAFKLWKQGKIKVIYTAHGFHFYKGAPLVNWILYYPIEKFLAQWTDIIITINEEDYDRAKKISKSIYKIDGVGVDLKRFRPCPDMEFKGILRKELGFSENDFIITVVAELNKNKNQIALVQHIGSIQKIIPHIKVLLIGKETESIVRTYVDSHNLNKVVLFLGYRNDVEKILSISDIGFSSSIREGLPVNIIESMACGLPIICSDNRGHRSLMQHLETGFLFKLDDEDKIKELILLLYKNPSLRKEIGERNIIVAQNFSLTKILPCMVEIYRKLM